MQCHSVLIFHHIGISTLCANPNLLGGIGLFVNCQHIFSERTQIGKHNTMRLTTFVQASGQWNRGVGLNVTAIYFLYRLQNSLNVHYW